MKSVIAAILTLAAGLLVANMLGVAVAEAPTVTPVRTVSVEGVATVPIAQNESGAGATAIYRQGMAAAVADGQGKAAFLASKAGATLGNAQSVAEGGGYITCTGSGESGYAEYEGEQPDFGSSPRTGVVSPLAAGTAPSVKRGRPTKHRHPLAKKATAGSCTLSAQVSLVYAMN